jgi:two-component system, sensor histidine kinase RegB
MRLPPLIRPHVYAHPTLDTAIWFMHLRWLAVFGQLAALLVVRLGLQVDLPDQKIGGLIAITAVTNLAYWFWLSQLHRRGLQLADRLPGDQVISSLMLIDVLDLTGLLYLSAGVANPFWLFYFVNIVMAAAIVTRAWAWTLWAVTVGCVILLLKTNTQPVSVLNSLQEDLTNSGGWTTPQLGYIAAFVTCSGIITYFTTILTGELRHREHAIKDAEEAKSRNRQLESLATLAAGAAHELASPLSTIAVVSKELSRALEKQSAPKPVLNDVGLIRSELNRCREILDRMTTATGDAAGEQLRQVSIREFINETLLGVRDVHRIKVLYDSTSDSSLNLLPVQAVAQALRNLVQNALDASPLESTVTIRATADGDQWIIDVCDQGEGMAQEVLERLGQPFFTTKEPGKGMGLGVYLAMNVMRRLGGTLKFVSQPGQGTTGQVSLPLAR